MVILAIVAVVLFWYVTKVYNTVKPLQISVSECESNIGVVLKKREVILDKLNDVVNSYSKYEKDIVERMSHDMMVNTNSMMSINRLSDAYPDLKLNQTFTDLVERLYNIETERQGTVEYYNSRVRYYNEEVTKFPAIMACSLISFKEKPFFSN